MKASSRRVKELGHVGHVLLVIASSIILYGLLFPAVPFCGERGDNAHGRNDINSLVTALKHYRTEYGHFPFPEKVEIADEATQVRLIRVLQGRDDVLNPRKVVFFEAREAKKAFSRQYRSGISPLSNALLDPWGNLYRVRFGGGDDQVIKSPYQDASEARVSVIAWSLGKDGIQGSPGKENILEDSDDIVSWR